MNENPHVMRGRLLLQHSRPELAQKELRLALAKEPDDAVAHALLAISLGELEQNEEALKEAQAAVGSAPDIPFTHYVLAKRLQGLERLTEAEAAIGEAIRLDPRDADHHAAMASICLERKQWPLALEWAERGLAEDAENTDCLNLRSITLVKMGRKDQAQATTAFALTRAPLNSNSHAVQGWNYLEQSEPKKALEHFREALRLDPQNEYARSGMVQALKARYLAYRLMLRYFLWMAKLSGKAQWAVIIGLYVFYQVLRGVLSAHPWAAPLIVPLLVLYFSFAAMSWFAMPMFNLTLIFNRYGWYALAPHERKGAMLFGGLLAAAVGTGLCYFLAGWELGIVLGLYFAAMLLPTAATFGMPRPKPRKTMLLLMLLVAALGLVSIGLDLVGNAAGENLWFAFILCCVAFGPGATYLALRRTYK